MIAGGEHGGDPSLTRPQPQALPGGELRDLSSDLGEAENAQFA